MLSLYFNAQVSSGCHRSLDFSLVRRPLGYYLSEQHGCPEKNQVILFHECLVSIKNCSMGEAAARAVGKCSR
jgi:hypothetical protein